MNSSKVRLVLDTNVYIREVIGDNDEMLSLSKSIFEKGTESNIELLIDNTILSEIIFVLTKIYKVNKEEVIEYINYKLNSKIINIKNRSKDAEIKALKFYSEYNVKWGDCLIAGNLNENETLITFDDKDFKKLKINYLTPKQLLNK